MSVHLVLLHIKRTKTMKQFINTISQQPEALDLFIVYCKEQEPDLLSELFSQGGLTDRALNHKFILAFDSKGVTNQKESFLQIVKELEVDKSKIFERSVALEQANLLQLQSSLDSEINHPQIRFVGKSVSDTIFNLVVIGKTQKQIRNICETFKVPDNRLWWIKIRAYASINNWEALFQLGKEKKSPIGYAVSFFTFFFCYFYSFSYIF